MKKSTYFFACSMYIYKPGIQEITPSATHSFKELVEVDEGETVPEAFDRWVTDCQDEAMKGNNPRQYPRPILTFTSVLAP